MHWSLDFKLTGQAESCQTTIIAHNDQQRALAKKRDTCAGLKDRFDIIKEHFPCFLMCIDSTEREQRWANVTWKCQLAQCFYKLILQHVFHIYSMSVKLQYVISLLSFKQHRDTTTKKTQKNYNLDSLSDNFMGLSSIFTFKIDLLRLCLSVLGRLL